MKKPLIVGNWKMYVAKQETAKAFAVTLKRQARLLSAADIVLAPSFTLVPVVAATLKPAKGRGTSSIRVAGQSLAAWEDGAHTGEVSATALRAAGASWVIVGHSERRGEGESHEAIRAQIECAHKAGLAVILCVGELERDPSGAHFSTIAQQLSSALGGNVIGTKLVIAYEPVWAIGKDAAQAMAPADVREMVIFIRKNLADILGRAVGLRVPILYGGSVEASNAGALLQDAEVAGFLVGRASADIDSFLELIRICKK